MAPVDPDGGEWVTVTASIPRGTRLSVYDNHEHYNPVLELLDADHRVIIISYTNDFSQQSGCKVEVFYDGKAQDKPDYIPLWPYSDKSVAGRVSNFASAASASDHAT
ncbi:hypothetical protein PG987_011755 [Apiospora arundinis]